MANNLIVRSVLISEEGNGNSRRYVLDIGGCSEEEEEEEEIDS